MLPLVPVAVSPPELRHRADQLSMRLHPGVRAWIDRQAREEAAHPHFDERRLREAVTRRFLSQDELAPVEADALVFLILKMAADVTEQAFAGAMDLLRRTNEEREALRAALAEYLETRALLKPAPPERAHLRLVPPVSDEHLTELDETAKGAGVRLQVTADVRNRLLSALLAAMKRIDSWEQPGLSRLG